MLRICYEYVTVYGGIVKTLPVYRDYMRNEWEISLLGPIMSEKQKPSEPLDLGCRIRSATEQAKKAMIY